MFVRNSGDKMGVMLKGLVAWGPFLSLTTSLAFVEPPP